MIPRRSLILGSGTRPCYEKRSVVVPTMGDSITEGTIVEWMVEKGQAVEEDDVIVMVETDKVTIDIKAEMPGVITERFGEVDDTIEVGANLYEIDTEAEATVQASKAPASDSADDIASEATVTTEPLLSSTMIETQEQHRIPLIKFLGKDGWARRLSGEEATTAATAPKAVSSPHETITWLMVPSSIQCTADPHLLTRKWKHL